MNNEINHALRQIANAITPLDTSGSSDAVGGFVTSLTEASMGHTKALVQVADSLNNIAQSIDNLADALKQNKVPF